MTGRALVFLIPGRLETRTGGYEYDRRIIDGLRARAWKVEVRALDDSFPQPTDEALAHARRVLAGIPDSMTVLVDGLALGAMPDVARGEARRLRLVGLVHHPLAGESGIDRATADRLAASERLALEQVRQVVVTSEGTAAALSSYGVGPERIAVVEPGTDRAPLARGAADGPIQLLCVGSLSPRKGHEILIRALARLRDRAWSLTCVGGAVRNSDSAARLRALLHAEQLVDRVHLVGEADSAAIAGYYDRSDLFVLATLYEGYGMVVAEALARGLPVLSTPTGAIAELVGTDAGRLIAPGDIDGWTEALAAMFDPTVRARAAEGARRVRLRLPTWDMAIDKMAEALTEREGPHDRTGELAG